MQKYILLHFSQLFGEEDPDQDVSPDTEDPELSGKREREREIHVYLVNERYRERRGVNFVTS